MFYNIHALVVVVVMMVEKLSNTGEFYVESQVNRMLDKRREKRAQAQDAVIEQGT